MHQHERPLAYCFLILTIQLQYGGVNKKRKCGVDFEYQLEGCGKPNLNKRYNAPHL